MLSSGTAVDDLLDRIAQCQPGDQRQAAAHRKEHKAADEAEMKPGDRQEMRQAGLAKRLLDLLGHRAALAGDGRRPILYQLGSAEKGLVGVSAAASSAFERPGSARGAPRSARVPASAAGRASRAPLAPV